ncbi:MAG: M23 family metallopeptidase [Bacteroidales bacterium]|nr:M23 family metallopeptidase [Bacteroidales bacterium]
MSGMKKYKFNADTLLYEVHKIPVMKRFSAGFVLFLLSLVAFVGYFFAYTLYFGLDTPKLALLKQESVKLQSKMELLERKFEQNNRVLLELQRRDNYVYRPIFGMEEISQDVRNAGFGGVNRYAHLENLPNSSFMVDMEKKMDILYKKAFIQSRSYDEVAILSKRTGEMASCVPAVPPVHLDKVRISSHFGLRTDPFNKTPKMHSGIDFVGSKGEPIYASGNGKVVEVAFNFFGYGKEVVIDHGFGYKTRYAHLNTICVKEGDMVERGEQIGDMGNSGRSTGTHLHYEVLYKDNRVNPSNYFSKELKGEEFLSMVKTNNSKES